MVEILFEKGKARELQESDISNLTEMCDDKNILRFFFSSGTRNIELYWHAQLSEQSRWNGRMSRDRNHYVLPIEHDETVKGCLILDVTANERKNDWPNYTVRRKIVPPGWGWVQPNHRSQCLHQIVMVKEPDGPLIERSYFIGEKYRRNGLASTVGRSALTFSTKELGAKRVIAKCLESNEAVRTLLEKQGYQVENKGIAGSGPSLGERILTYRLFPSVFDEMFVL